MREIVISETESNQRLDKFLLKYLNKCHKNYLYKCFRTNKIKYNCKKAKGDEQLRSGDVVKIFLLDEQLYELEEVKYTKEKITFDIIFEDDNILIVNKPLGLLSQKDYTNEVSLADQVTSYFYKNYKETRGFRPAPCNRLDRNTAGIVLLGKNLLATQVINEMLKSNYIFKYYVAIVKGHFTKPITLKGYHIKDNFNNKVSILDEPIEGAKLVETKIIPLQIKGNYTLIEVNLITGKTHQIRAHLSQIGHPIIGDMKYGDQDINTYFKTKYKLNHQFLLAYKMKVDRALYPLEYLEERVFIAGAPLLYAKIFKEEGFIINV